MYIRGGGVRNRVSAFCLYPSEKNVIFAQPSPSKCWRWSRLEALEMAKNEEISYLRIRSLLFLLFLSFLLLITTPPPLRAFESHSTWAGIVLVVDRRFRKLEIRASLKINLTRLHNLRTMQKYMHHINKVTKTLETCWRGNAWVVD